ncbi:hypothetical protein D187_008783 [Cystobacter fuscus DSM 2262]|uniref:PatA-like N-terminal domain-containing protein n=1 Tax=Cystobacter fuscus (strain ATCC 25194 / DSM 2262 / NBRC 100088 / M29) TaxID=1242864 RepID=S9PE16_CYSF2|nr:DUF4388 domain-containing protein [Cystobacter fuscus]EPX62595.1 hypothetical protein D187_008783 [Cystobacter fuscus DSM 2262]
MSARFRIEGSQLVPDERPGVSPPSPSGLAGRAGSYILQPTSPDLLVFSRSPAEGGSLPTPRVVLSGDASGFPLSDLIAFLSQSRWSGIVRVQAPSGERSVVMREGEVRGATSDVAADRLGEVLVRLGYVDRAQLEAVLREQPPSKIGRTLVERGLLQAHDLFRCVTHQVSEIFHSIVLCREGSFFLVDQPVEDKLGHNIQLSTQSLLMDSIRKIDELAHFRKRIPHSRLYVLRKGPTFAKLEPDEDRVLGLVDGRRTLLELGQASRLSEFDVTKVVYGLLEGGFVSLSDKALGSPVPSMSGLPTVRPRSIMGIPVVRPSSTGIPAVRMSQSGIRAITAHQEPPPVVAVSEVVSVFNRIFREIATEVAKQGLAREFIASANAALSGQALSSSPVLAGLSFAADGSLSETKLREAYDQHRGSMGSEPVAAFRQALSDVMFFLLFQAGELLESRADEDLARRVKDMLSTLGGG